MKNKSNITIKRIGVFMDHSGVTLLNPDSLEVKSFTSGIEHQKSFNGEGGGWN
ncbi:MAG: hypothetical protein IPJ79_14410 [Bacteroidetes bacterium]|nr:hypothetical protein [Bacteroidota bacterium]